MAFTWNKACQDAYEHVRDALLAGIHLAAPNFEIPFHLQTDASEDGKGAILYQLPQCEVDKQFPYCKKIHAPECSTMNCDTGPFSDFRIHCSGM